MFENFERYIVHDITVPMHNKMVCWPGEHHRFNHEYVKSMDMGDKVNISRISASMHTGTHLDTPHHKINKRETLDEYHIQAFMGRAYVIDLTNLNQHITKDDFQDKSFESYQYVLMKTSNSKLLEHKEFNEDYIALEPSAAEYLVKQDLKGVCIDYFSIDAFEIDNPVSHEIIFNSDTMIYEGVDLRNINEGEYYFIGLPLKLIGTEGSLVRAILFEDQND